jgi:hypothetical protein
MSAILGAHEHTRTPCSSRTTRQVFGEYLITTRRGDSSEATSTYFTTRISATQAQEDACAAAHGGGGVCVGVGVWVCGGVVVVVDHPRVWQTVR